MTEALSGKLCTEAIRPKQPTAKLTKAITHPKKVNDASVTINAEKNNTLFFMLLTSFPFAVLSVFVISKTNEVWVTHRPMLEYLVTSYLNNRTYEIVLIP